MARLQPRGLCPAEAAAAEEEVVTPLAVAAVAAAEVAVEAAVEAVEAVAAA